jgi:hypothetical protein
MAERGSGCLRIELDGVDDLRAGFTTWQTELLGLPKPTHRPMR